MNKNEFYKMRREQSDKTEEAFRLKIKERENSNKVYDSIKDVVMSLGIEKDQIDSFMKLNNFTISFGEQDVIVDRDNPIWVKINGVSIKIESK